MIKVNIDVFGEIFEGLNLAGQGITQKPNLMIVLLNRAILVKPFPFLVN